MNRNRIEALRALARGLATAVAVTLLCMALTAGAALFLGLTDAGIHWANQGMKLLAIALGAWAAIGRGGRRGFVTGTVLAMVYMLLGYGLYLALGGGTYDTAEMLGEVLLGAAAGGIAGAVLSNLPPRPARRRIRAAQPS